MKARSLMTLLAALITFLVVLIITRIMNAKRIHSIATTDRNVQAFLRTIRACEGTDGPDGYRMMFTGKLFNDMSQHPNQLNKANGYSSTAAGAYQFIFSTWKRLQLTLGLPDFSPESQDAAAVELIQEKGALGDVQAGNIEAAFAKLNKTWASLPGSPYGQPTKSTATASAYFTQYGGTIA